MHIYYKRKSLYASVFIFVREASNVKWKLLTAT